MTVKTSAKIGVKTRSKMGFCLDETDGIHMKFKQLIDIIRKTHFSLQQRAVSAVDRNLIQQIGQTLSA